MHTTSQEIQRNNIIDLRPIKRLTTHIHTNEFTPIARVRVIRDLDPIADLDDARDSLLVVLVDTGIHTLERLPQLIAIDLDLNNSVSEGEGCENLTASDGSLVDSCAHAAGVDECEVCGVGLVEAVGEHGVGHELAQETFGAAAGCLVELDVGEADFFGGEGFEGTAP